MLPARLQSSLAAAERALGQLDAALSDPGIRRRHRADAQHRAVPAALRLDGLAVSADDLRLIEVAPEVVAPAVRTDALLGAAVQRWTDALDSGRFFGEGILTVAPAAAGLPPSASPPPCGLAADGLRAALEGPALVTEEAIAATIPSILTFAPERTADKTPTLMPWTAPWAMAALSGWTRVQGRPGPDAEAADAVSTGLEAVARTLAAAPGLDGALRVVVQLHHRTDPPLLRRGSPDPFEPPLAQRQRQDAQACASTGFWTLLARLAAPSLLRRACGLNQAELPLVVSLAATPALFRTMLVAPEEEAVGWLLDRVASQAKAELERLDALEGRAAARRATLRGRRRDAGAWTLLERLEEEPALTLRQAALRLGCSERATRTSLNLMSEAGILRPLPAWREEESRSRQLVRPLVWLAADTVLERTMAIKPPARRVQRRKDMEPPGTAMHWQPIATAPQNGKRCLVWAGRPAFAVFASPKPGAPPVWRDGARVLQPTHWLPLAPPGQDEAAKG